MFCLISKILYVNQKDLVATLLTKRDFAICFLISERGSFLLHLNLVKEIDNTHCHLEDPEL